MSPRSRVVCGLWVVLASVLGSAAASDPQGVPTPPSAIPILILASAEGPRYPEDALRRGVSGRVFMHLFVDPTGEVSRIEVLHERPTGEGFVEAVVTVVPRWRYFPGTRHGIPVPSLSTEVIEFEAEPSATIRTPQVQWDAQGRRLPIEPPGSRPSDQRAFEAVTDPHWRCLEHWSASRFGYVA